MKNGDFEQLLRENFTKSGSIVPYRRGNNAYSYDRVSSKEQMTNGNSLVWQFERIDKFADQYSYVIKKRYGGTYESAKSDERKEFQRMLSDVKKDKSISTILVYSYDRFSRSGANGIFLLENLKKLGVKIVAVTQEVDSTTPTGNFQQNLYMLLSKLENDMRRDKSISGTKSLLQKGFWPYSTPRGYINSNPHTTADKHSYIINEEGEKLKKAFIWKASGKFTNQQILVRLSAMGVRVTIRHLAWILANPFYCGYISVALLPGEIIKGKHPALIDEETFLKANQISKANPRSGVKKIRVNPNLPLKIFMRDSESGSSLTGYLNNKKKLYYYKSIKPGTNVSVSAKSLNLKFETILSGFHYDMKYKEKLKSMLLEKLKSRFAGEHEIEKHRRKRISEIRGQLEKIEERFVLGEISPEHYTKYSSLYKSQIEKIEQEIDQVGKISSNLEKAVQKGLDYAQNLSQMWVSFDYHEKQRLQYLVFPEGMMYDNKNDHVLTSRVNTLFSGIASLSNSLEENKKENSLENCLFGSKVVPPRIELGSKV